MYTILWPQLNASCGERGGGDCHHQGLGPEKIWLNKDLRIYIWTLYYGPSVPVAFYASGLPTVVDRLTEHLFKVTMGPIPEEFEVQICKALLSTLGLRSWWGQEY